MPQLRDVTVHVTDVDGNALEEWGVQNLRGDKVSTYIRSITDMPFRISIQPKIPYFNEELAAGDSSQRSLNEGSEDVPIKLEYSSDDYIGESSSSRRRFGKKPSEESIGCPKVSRGLTGSQIREIPPTQLNHPDVGEDVTKPVRGNTPVPFALIATLYLDGRGKPERRIVVYLDPNDEDFNRPDGLVKFKCRCVQGRDGVLKEHAWVFKDIGIETMFNQIALREDGKDALEPLDLLVDALNSSELSDEHARTTDESGKIGQIVVVLERVVLGKKYKDYQFRPKHIEGDRDDVDMGEQLQKFNFAGYPQDPQKRPSPERKPLNTALANLTPLSIAHCTYKASVNSKQKGPSFEKRVRDASYDLSKFQRPEYEFQDYRDPLTDIPEDPQRESSNGSKGSTSTRSTHDSDNVRRSPSKHKDSPAVVAAKERTTTGNSHQRVTIGATKSRSSSVSSLTLSEPPPSPPIGSPAQLPVNSPSTGFYNPVADPRLSTHRGTEFDIFKTISSASLALTKAEKSSADGKLTPKSVINNNKIFREGSNSSSDADADDEKEGGRFGVGAGQSDDDDDDENSEESDKENRANRLFTNDDHDDAGLHEEFKMVSLGTKRQRGEGTEELDDGEIVEEDDESIIGADTGKKKMKTSPTRGLELAEMNEEEQSTNTVDEAA
ncbi:MAG: hypothetical protein Q9178_001550 [Gyalolechia marmorata]